jgi:tetratricopeptide (TPR) repeat protein
MLRDAGRRFHLDGRRQYAAGLSGGARVACALAGNIPLAGVIACSGGFPGPVPDEVPFVFFGTAGQEDFNFQEMRDVNTTLEQRRIPHRLGLFAGAHEWLPASLASTALEWLELQAMRRGLAPRNDAWIQQQLHARLQAARALKNEGETYVECTALLADFDNLADTVEVATLVKALKDSRNVRRFLAADKKAEQEEARWNARLMAAIAQARAGVRPPSALALAGRQTWKTHRMEPEVSPFDRKAGAGYPSDPRNAWPDNSPVDPATATEPADQFAGLRKVVEDMDRQWERNVAVRRSLRAASASAMDQGVRNLMDRDYAAAVEALEIAVILQPEDPSRHFHLAWAYGLLGRKSAALDSLQLAVTKGYDNSERLHELRHALEGSQAGILELEPFTMHAKRALRTSFGLGLVIHVEPETRQIERILVNEVSDDSEAMAKGLGPGGEILGANGRSVRSLAANFQSESEFSRLFMHQQKGDRIELDVIKQPGQPRTKLTLTQGRDARSVAHPATTWEEP